MGVRAGEIELHQYWQLFSSMAEPVFICDAVGRIRLGNPALVQALGLQDAHEITGKPLAAIIEDQTLPADLLKRAAREACSAEVSLAPHQTACLLSLSPIFSESRRVLLAGALHDLSDQKRQQAALQKGYTDLQALHRQLEDLNAQLEQKVEERTHTLSQAYQQMEEQNKRLAGTGPVEERFRFDGLARVTHAAYQPVWRAGIAAAPKDRSASDRSTSNVNEGRSRAIDALCRKYP